MKVVAPSDFIYNQSMPTPKNFVHLHNHSHYSLLDGLSRFDGMIKKAKKSKMPAIALTDHGNMYGAIPFYKKCKDADIKPILGVEAYIAKRSRLDREPGIDNKRYHLTLLAENNTGYKNLLKLVTLSNTEGFYYKPRMDKEILRKHNKGLICLSGCLGSELGQALLAKDYDGAEKIIAEHLDIFGPDNYFLEIMHHPKIDRQIETKEKTIELAKKLNIPLVATQDAHYMEPDDAKAHDTLIAVQQTNKDASKRFSNIDEDFSFLSSKDAIGIFRDTPEAVENTVKIAERCNIEIELGKWVFPDFEIPKDSDYDTELKNKAYTALKKYQAENPDRVDEAKERVDYELKIIKDKGYSSYFLIVADILDYSHRNGIFTNTRGSAAGSMVSHLTGITNIDPLFYELPFERFLNPERPSAPDIDMDFADKRRDEVLDYVREKYGEDKVAQIGTFGSMLARGSVRDVARALDYPYNTGDEIAKLIPLGAQGFPMTIDRAIKMVPELRKMYDDRADVKEVIDLAKKIEGAARHISVHAAGVVISPTPITDFCPVQFDPKGGKIISQYDMHAVEDAGLIKFDFLGIRNLSILEDSVRIVKKTQNIIVDIEKIPLDDKKTFELLARGETTGLFQLNGAGITKFLKDLKPTSIHDINAMVALYRPGPMEVIPEYIRRKNDPSLIKYLDPRMKQYLEKSYGLIVYQEDLLFSTIHLAGYSWLEADKFRKAVGKKIPKEMAAQKGKLVEGIIKNGQTKEFAEKLWQLFEPFQAYGFGKAHAASYGRVAYQTAYMKANFPGEYMTAILSAESGDTDKIAEIIHDCKRMNLPVLPPDINESFEDFGVIKDKKEGDKIRFGLVTIKNLGSDISEAVVRERKENGKYTSLSNFLERVRHKNLNKKSMDALTKSGALDSLGESRGKLLHNMELILEYNKELNKTEENQGSLFDVLGEAGAPSLNLQEAEAVPKADILAWEKELLGLYISGHPLEAHKERFEKNKHDIEKIKKEREGALVVIGGVIEEVKVINTKKGDRMAFVRIADFKDTIEGVVFASTYEQYKEVLEVDKCVAIRGRVSYRGGDPSLIVEAIKLLE